jgi:hypothetical protein
MVILGSGGSGKHYPHTTALLTDPTNRVDPVAAAKGKRLVVFEVVDGSAVILAQGVKVSCDGGTLVLGIIPDEYEYAGGVPILGTGGTEDVEPGEPTEKTVTLEGRQVADGDVYHTWQKRRTGEAF